MTTTEGTKMTQIHVTRVSGNGDVYGHDTRHCDETGCNGDERYYSSLRGSTAEGDGGCVCGDVVDERRTESKRNPIAYAQLLQAKDEYEHVVGMGSVVAEVVRGHVGTGRLLISLPRGSLKHLQAQLGDDVIIDCENGLAWCHPNLSKSVREIALALASAR
jgi:hypothetical protein